MIISSTKEGKYILGYPNGEESSYIKNVFYYPLYDKPDIKDLPDTPEEFRKQFKMDKKAEKEYKKEIKEREERLEKENN